MERRLIVLILFYTGFVPLLQSVPRKYYLIHQAKSWSDAQAYCRAVHTDLAIVQNNKDLIRLQNEIQTEQVSSSAWMGLSVDVNSWRWSMGNEPLADMSMFNTPVGQPNNYLGQEECAINYAQPWLDFDCNLLLPFVCFDARLTGNQRYIYIANEMTWHDAQAYCRQYHTDLASARDPTENQIIKALTSYFTWFGLFRDSWKWIDQTDFSDYSTLSWVTGQPDNFMGKEDCGYLNNGLVADGLCSDLLPFFCYRNVTGQQQIVKLHVQSNEDVNDPAVNAAILDQIKKKLEENGIKDFTVKWRKLSE